MSLLLSNDNLIVELLKAVGAPEGVRSGSIHFAVDEAVIVRLEYFAVNDTGNDKAIIRKFSEYKLCERDGGCVE
jgi:hypothetical protein